jgi:hypothetical protein
VGSGPTGPGRWNDTLDHINAWKLRDDLEQRTFVVGISPSGFDMVHTASCGNASESPEIRWVRVPTDFVRAKFEQALDLGFDRKIGFCGVCTVEGR